MHRATAGGETDMRVWAMAILPFFVAGSLSAAAKPPRQGTVSLRWAVGALEASGGKPSGIQRDTRLGTGSKLKLLVEPMSPGWVYLVLLDSSQELHVLYRKSSAVSRAHGAKPTYIPPGSQWFELEKGAGMETFFLLASIEPLEELERLLDRHEAAPGADRKDAAAAVVEEVRRLNRAYRNLTRPVERPVMIGGQTRGTKSAADAIDQLAVEVEAERFYAKTITIDH
jgi:hypothetical protein